MPTSESELIEFIRLHSAQFTPSLPSLPDEFASLVGTPLPRPARAALFDIYGTLFTSDTGDISMSRMELSERAAGLALKAVRIDTPAPSLAQSVVERFRYHIEHDHQKRRELGAAHPEIEVRQIWRLVFDDLELESIAHEVDRFALAYEMEANPVWPMPHTSPALDRMRACIALGIVSNAQFYTPLLFPALLGATTDQLGFSRACIAYSYKHGIAKPDPAIFDGPLAALAEQGIDFNQVVYVGNDMLNDVATAASRGCMTILYAGDTRSLRLRRGHPGVDGVMPDTVAESLEQVASTVIDLKEEP